MTSEHGSEVIAVRGGRRQAVIQVRMTACDVQTVDDHVETEDLTPSGLRDGEVKSSPFAAEEDRS